jgi:hypothetical protein
VRALVLAALIGVAGAVVAAPQDPSPPAPEIKTAPRIDRAELQELRDEVRRLERIPLMVGVRLPDDMADFQVNDFLERGVREKLDVPLSELLDRLSERDPDVKRSFAKLGTVPFVALTSDSEGIRELERLIDQGIVTHVRRVTRLQPAALAESDYSLSVSLAKIGIGPVSTTSSGGGARVVVIDDGIDHTASWLGGRVVSGAYFVSGADGTTKEQGIGVDDPEPGKPANPEGISHGTLVASVLAGENAELSAVAPEVEIISIRVASYEENGATYIWDSDVASALQHVVDLAQDDPSIAAVNISLVGKLFMDMQDCEEKYADFRSLVKQLQELGVAVVASSGNAGAWTGISFPACIPEVLAVGATHADSSDTIWKWSNSNESLDYWAPGVLIDISAFTGDDELLSGTSFAAPMVTGAWARLRSQWPGASWGECNDALEQGGKWLKDKRNKVWKRRIDVSEAADAMDTQSAVPVSASTSSTD